MIFNVNLVVVKTVLYTEKYWFGTLFLNWSIEVSERIHISIQENKIHVFYYANKKQLMRILVPVIDNSEFVMIVLSL